MTTRRNAMDEGDVLAVLDALRVAKVTTWLEGGWGVDALLGERTRQHADVDLAVSAGELSAAQIALDRLGYRHRDDVRPGMPARFVLEDSLGRCVDLHPLLFDEYGNGWQQLSATGRSWGCHFATDLGASGSIAGRSVVCVSPAFQLRVHLGYEWREVDVHDVDLLTARFGLPKPPTGA